MACAERVSVLFGEGEALALVKCDYEDTGLGSLNNRSLSEGFRCG